MARALEDRRECGGPFYIGTTPRNLCPLILGGKLEGTPIGDLPSISNLGYGTYGSYL